MNTIKRWLLKKGNLLALCSGIMLGLSNPGIGYWGFAWVGLLPAFFALRISNNWKEACIQGLITGGVYHGTVFIWLFGMHPVTWMGFSEMASMLVTIGAWLIATVTQGVIIMVIWFFMFQLLQKNIAYIFLILSPILWISGIWFLNQNPIGLPWGFLTYSQASIPWIRQSSYALTFWGVEFLIVLVNISIFQLIYLKQPKRIVPAIFAFLLIFICNLSAKPADNKIIDNLHPVVIQGNIPLEAERLILTPREKQSYYQAMIDHAIKTYDKKSRLLILPEGIVFVKAQTGFRPFIFPDNIYLLTGGMFQSLEGDYNGAILFINNKKPQTFGKRYLVPFGETTPFIPEDWLVDQMRKIGIDYSRGFLKAPFKQSMLELDNIKVGPFICFEALYPNIGWYYRQNDAKLFVTLSNLGWFHQQPLLEKQFLAINQIRAAESGVPMILSTNTGVSAIIDEHGDIIAQSKSGKTGFLTSSDRFTEFNYAPR